MESSGDKLNSYNQHQRPDESNYDRRMMSNQESVLTSAVALQVRQITQNLQRQEGPYSFTNPEKTYNLIGQEGNYEVIYELLPKIDDQKCFTFLALAYDVKKGFVLVVNNNEKNMLRYIARAILESPEERLTFIERFKAKTKNKHFQFYAVLKIATPPNVKVSAPQVKQ